MSETAPQYDTGEVRVHVTGAAVDAAWAAIDLESVWHGLTGDNAWGEMVVTFRNGRATVVTVSQTYRFD